MQYNDETQFVSMEPGNGSTFDDILQSVQAGIDAWRSNGNTNGGFVGPIRQPVVTTVSNDNTALILVLLIALIFFAMKD